MRILKSTHPNIITVLSSKVESTARLPLKLSGGSAKQREKLADFYTQKMEDGLERISDTKQCKVDDFLGLINEIVFPAKINVEITPIKNRWNHLTYVCGSIMTKTKDEDKITRIGSVVIDSSHRSIVGYNINLPLNKDNTVIKNKFSAFHEVRHLFDYICNPKTIDSKLLKFADSKRKAELYAKIKNMFISDINLFGGIKEKATKELENFSDDEAITCLQNIRHHLKTEINAYRDTIKYMRKYPIQNFFIINGSNEFILFRNYPRRLEIANRLLAERLKESRKNNYNTFAQQK